MSSSLDELAEDERAGEQRLRARGVEPEEAGELGDGSPPREADDELEVLGPIVRPTSFAAARALPPTASAAEARGGDRPTSASRAASRAAVDPRCGGRIARQQRAGQAQRADVGRAHPGGSEGLRSDRELGRAAADVADRDHACERRARARRRRTRGGPPRRQREREQARAPRARVASTSSSELRPWRPGAVTRISSASASCCLAMRA